MHRQLVRLNDDEHAKDEEEMMIQIEQTAEQISMAERRAEAATREAIQWLKCEFMSHKIGESLSGVVSSVTDFGLFVELEEFYVDGLVHITSLGQDYYRFDAERRQLKGESSGQIYKTGQKLKVQVARVDMDQGRIDFSLTDVKNAKFDRRKSSNKSSKKYNGKTKNKGARSNNKKRRK